MTTSLAGAGAGLGTCGFTEEVARTMCTEAGFSSFRKVPTDDSLNNLCAAVA